jgi:hypothetical protein
MADWPSIDNPDYGLDEEYYKPQVRQEFEANYVQSRPRSTRGRSRWALHWDLLSEADYQTLLAFFAANQGGVFTWIHPISSASYTCRFSGDVLKSRIVMPDCRAVDCPIEEV